MKKLFLLSALLAATIFAEGQTNAADRTSGKPILFPPKIDKRVELLSIVFRLAGNNEYNMDGYKQYVQDIHDHFDKYKDHPLVAFAKELRDSNGVSYDAVMSMAIHVSQPPELKPLIPFSEKIPEERWGPENATKFVTLLQQFYTDARCSDFFKAEEKVYGYAEEKFRVIYDSLDLSWFKKYYGKLPGGEFNIVLGLGIGGNNYGPNIVLADGREVIYAIEGSRTVDSLGRPAYKVPDYLPTLIHEFNHSFVNYLIYNNKKALERSGESVFKQVKEKMKVQAYASWQTMLCEALVRASVIRYLKSHSPDEKWANKELISQQGNGFVWMKELVALLDQYEHDRQQYPTLESFMPRIISFYATVAKDFTSINENYDRLCPHVVAIEQFKNGDQDVDAALTEIKIRFDKPLSGKGYSIHYGDKGTNHYPKIGTVTYADNNASIILKTELKPGMEYQFIVSGLSFTTPDGYKLPDYEINFKTRK